MANNIGQLTVSVNVDNNGIYEHFIKMADAYKQIAEAFYAAAETVKPKDGD